MSLLEDQAFIRGLNEERRRKAGVPEPVTHDWLAPVYDLDSWQQRRDFLAAYEPTGGGAA